MRAVNLITDPTDYGESTIKISTFYSVTSPSEPAILEMLLECLFIGILFGSIQEKIENTLVPFFLDHAQVLWWKADLARPKSR